MSHLRWRGGVGVCAAGVLEAVWGGGRFTGGCARPLSDLRVRAFSALLGGPPGRMLNRWFNLAPRVFFARGFAQPVPAEVMSMYFAPWRDAARRPPAAIAPRQLVAASGYLADLEAAIPAISDRMALIVWGEKDFAFRQEARARFEELFPDHRTVLLPNASHFLQEDSGEQIAAEIRKFRAHAS